MVTTAGPREKTIGFVLFLLLRIALLKLKQDIKLWNGFYVSLLSLEVIPVSPFASSKKPAFAFPHYAEVDQELGLTDNLPFVTTVWSDIIYQTSCS
jgi:hypothetical protein